MTQNENDQNQADLNHDPAEKTVVEEAAEVSQTIDAEQVGPPTEDTDIEKSENQTPEHEVIEQDQEIIISDKAPTINIGDDADTSIEKDDLDVTMQVNEDLIGDKQKHWYVINTYSGYEDNVRQALKQRIDSMDMTHKIFEVIVPKEKKVEIRNGKKKIVEKKIFPGYVLVQMIVDEDSWYVVRNTPNVTGFIGFGSKPTPLSDEEVKKIQKRMGIEEPEYKIDFKEGESVRIVDGPFKDFDGVIADIDKIRGKIKVLVSMFGRETPVELDALQIERL